MGGAIGPIAVAHYYQQLRRLNSAMGLQEKPVAIAVTLSVVLAAIGVGMAGVSHPDQMKVARVWLAGMEVRDVRQV